MTKKIFFEALFKYLLGVVLIGVLIFIPAGSINYVNGWVFMAVLFIPMLIVGIILMIKNPKLLKERLNAKEKQKEQSIVIKLSGMVFVIGFILAGLDFRFGWIKMPVIATYIAIFIFLFGYIMWAEVLRENTYLSRIIKVEEEQKVIDSGLYGIVRHPMYLATIIMFLSMPLVLGSFVSLIVFLFYPILIIIRIISEEKLLKKELKGYADYMKKVRYRIIPFIW